MMKKVVLRLLILFAGFLTGCDKESGTIAVDGASVDSNGLSLYWDHEVFGEGGRRYRFEFYTKKPLLEEYDLVFQWSISGHTITARLVSTVSRGKCPMFPGTGPECTSRGKFYIPEKELPPGTYTFNLITPTFVESARLTVTAEKAVLDLGSSQRFTSAVTEVFPLPRQLLFGSIVYTGSDKTPATEELIAFLSKLGVTPVNPPDYPYRHLTVSQVAHLTTKDWPVDNHMISLLYSMDKDFGNIIRELATYFDRTDPGLTVYLYTSWGDEAHLSKSERLIVRGADQ